MTKYFKGYLIFLFTFLFSSCSTGKMDRVPSEEEFGKTTKSTEIKQNTTFHRDPR